MNSQTCPKCRRPDISTRPARGTRSNRIAAGRPVFRVHTDRHGAWCAGSHMPANKEQGR